MLLERAKLIDILTAAGVYRPTWAVLDDTYETLDPVWLAQQAWPAWVQSLPPHLRTTRDIGGGKSIPAPVWISNVWDCDNHAWSFWEFVMRCRAESIAAKDPRGEVGFCAGSAAGTLAYLATPKAGNLRQGGHDIFWFIDDAGDFRVFEAADGAFDVLSRTECLSVWEGEAR